MLKGKKAKKYLELYISSSADSWCIKLCYTTKSCLFNIQHHFHSSVKLLPLNLTC